MATEVENLLLVRGRFIQQLADLSVSPRPNYSIGGRSVSWQQYMEFLIAKIAEVNGLIAGADPVDVVTAIE